MAQSLLPSDINGRQIGQLGNYTIVPLTATGVTPLINIGDYTRQASNRIMIVAIGIDTWTAANSTPTVSFGSGAAANDWSSAAVVTGPVSLPNSITTFLMWGPLVTIYAASTLLFQANVTATSLGSFNVTVYGENY